MKIEELTKAFWVLNSHGNKGKVVKVENGFIFIKRGSKLQIFSIKRLVGEYNKEYGE